MLSHKDMNTLMKLCGMLGSDQHGERAAAGHKATELLKRNKLTWSDFFKQLVNGTYMAPPKVAPAQAAPTPEAPRQPEPKSKIRRPKTTTANSDYISIWVPKINYCMERDVYLTTWNKDNLAGMAYKIRAGFTLTATQEKRLTKMIARIVARMKG